MQLKLTITIFSLKLTDKRPHSIVHKLQHLPVTKQNTRALNINCLR